MFRQINLKKDKRREEQYAEKVRRIEALWTMFKGQAEEQPHTHGSRTVRVRINLGENNAMETNDTQL